MVKNIFTAVLVFVLACFMAIGCTKKQAKVKTIVPTSTVKIDTIIRFNKDAACKIHINYVYLKGKQYATANDSLLRMGTLQPNYFATSYEKLTPQQVIERLVQNYGKEYLDLARWLKDREHAASQLDWALNIDTRILSGKENYVVYISNISIKTGETITKYSLCFNIDPKTGRQITLEETFGDDYKATLTEKIVEQMAKNNGWDNDDVPEAQAKGYFVGIKPYPSTNFILYDDSTTFIYSPGEINPNEVRVTIEN